VIAYEMAAQLVQAGEAVALLALLETVTPKALERPRRILDQRLNRLKQAIADAEKTAHAPLRRAALVVVESLKKVANALLWEIAQLGRQAGVTARFYLLRAVLKRDLPWPKFVPELSVRQIYDSAHARYTPKPLPIVSVVLARAQSGEGDDTPYQRIYADETFGWKDLVPSLAVLDVNGGHSTMLEERFVESLAKALLPHLRLSGDNPLQTSIEEI
jgi:phthiocerol/phenolphthiocerol synthesis type-I polyketide synthase D